MGITGAGFVAISALLTCAASGQIISLSVDENTATITIGAQHAPIGAFTGAPYSADQIFEHTQPLVDGTRVIQSRQIEHIARDSQGRTRTERSLATANSQGEPILIQISDPVAGYRYILDAYNKVAHRIAAQALPQQPAATRVAPRQTSSDAMRYQTSSEKLGTQIIEGVVAEGRRTTTIWPVNSQGNDRPLTETTESWFSQELKAMVLSKHSSLRNGESVTKLTNISRAEPDLSLFQPPPDYTIVDETGQFTMTIPRQ